MAFAPPGMIANKPIIRLRSPLDEDKPMSPSLRTPHCQRPLHCALMLMAAMASAALAASQASAQAQDAPIAEAPGAISVKALTRALGFDVDTLADGVVVAKVYPDTSASKFGLREGDLLLN